MVKNPRYLQFFVCLLKVFLLSAWANASSETPLTIESGKQTTQTYTQRITRVAVGDPEIADVTLVSDRHILITAKKPGATTLLVWHRGGERQSYPDHSREILVLPSTSLQSHAAQALPSSDLIVSGAGSKLGLSGQSPSLDAHARLRELLQEKDAPIVDSAAFGFDNQVQIDIKIVEINRTKMKNAGIFLGKNTSNKTLAISSPGTVAGVEGDGGAFTLLSQAAGFFPHTQAFNLIYGNASKGILGVVSVLENNGFAYTLAEPSLVTMSGQTADFLAGGEFPIPIRAGGNVNSGITVRFKKFGVLLRLTPTVLDANRIALKVAPEVSELDFSAGIESGGVSVPALRVRRTDTTIALASGESFVISGLVSQQTLANVEKVPWLGDIPILGAFFRSSSIDRNDRELVMIVSPHLVRAIAKGSELPTLPGAKFQKYDPDFYQFFLEETGDYGTRAVRSGFSN